MHHNLLLLCSKAICYISSAPLVDRDNLFSQEILSLLNIPMMLTSMALLSVNTNQYWAQRFLFFHPTMSFFFLLTRLQKKLVNKMMEGRGFMRGKWRMDALVHTFFFFLFFFLTNKSQKVTRAEQMQSWCNTIIIHKFTNTSKREKKRKGNKSPNTIPHMTSMHGFTRLLQSDISSFLSHLQKKPVSCNSVWFLPQHTWDGWHGNEAHLYKKKWTTKKPKINSYENNNNNNKKAAGAWGGFVSFHHTHSGGLKEGEEGWTRRRVRWSDQGGTGADFYVWRRT